MTKPALSSETLSKSFGGLRAVDGVTVSFSQGEISAIIGPNGAGKTTFVNLLTGFLAPDEGRILLSGREITGLPAFQVARLGVVRTFQDLRLLHHESVLGNVLLAGSAWKSGGVCAALLGTYRRDRRGQLEAARRHLDFVGLSKHASALGGELSYGQQKLLTVSCCLASEAEVLVLDEPISGVHPEMIEHILSLLTKIQAEGRTIIFVEHDLKTVDAIADFVVVMFRGQVIVRGTAKDVLARQETLDAFVR